MKLKYLIVFLMAFTMIACSKDDMCTDVKSTIVGSWKFSNIVSSGNDVTFNADGTMTDINGAFIEANGKTADKWEIDASNNLIVGIANESGDGYSSKISPMPTNVVSCDKIELSLSTLTFELTK